MTTKHDDVQPDGYCLTCEQVPCRGKPQQGPKVSQLDRLESKINRMMRAMKLDPDRKAS